MIGITRIHVLAFAAILMLSNPEYVQSQQAKLVITDATLIDGTGSPPREGTTIIIGDGIIETIAPTDDTELPARATVIDASGKFVIPGLIDLHAHGTEEDVLRQYLFYGVTTVLQMGGTGAGTDAIHELRSRRGADLLQVPHIYGTGGHLTLHGTHPIYTIFPPHIRQTADSLAAATPLNEPVNLYPLGIGLSFVRTEEAARKAVRERAADKMDAIKITVDSGPWMFGDNHPQMSVDMIKVIVDEAERHSLPVFAHISSVDELESTMEGGVTTLAHAVADDPMPGPEHVRMLVKNGTNMVPTLALFYAFHRYIDDPTLLNEPFLRAGVGEAAIEQARNSPIFRLKGVPDFYRRTLPRVIRHVGYFGHMVPLVSGHIVPLSISDISG